MRALPAELHEKVIEGLERAGIEQPLLAPGRSARGGLAGADDRHHGHGLGQVDVLQPAHARRALPRPAGARDLPLPHEGARPGPGACARLLRAHGHGPARDLRRRHAARDARADPQERERRSDATPTCCTWGSCPTTRPGPTCSRTSRWSWSTRRTSTAASSARTSRTCCGGCGGSRRPTGPSRG